MRRWPLVLLALALVSQGLRAQGVATRFGVSQLGSDAYLDDAVEAGAGWAWRDFRWEQIEPSQDAFDFGIVDDWWFNTLKPAGLEAIFIIRTEQCWATDNEPDSALGPIPSEKSSTPPLDYDDYYDFIYTLVEHFRGEVEHFQIENEVAGLLWWYGTGEEYNLLRARAYAAAKAANPDAVILANKLPAVGLGVVVARALWEAGDQQGALDFWNGYFSRYPPAQYHLDTVAQLDTRLHNPTNERTYQASLEVMGSGAATSCDVLTYNSYMPYQYSPWVVGWLKAQMQGHGYAKPLWDMEAGIKDFIDALTMTRAAEEVIKSQVVTFSLGVEKVIWYPFSLDTSSVFFDHMIRLVDFDSGERLEPYSAYKALATRMGGNYEFDSHLTPDGADRYIFRRAGGGAADLEVLWSDIGDRALSLPVPAGFIAAKIVDHRGTLRGVLYPAGGSISLSVGRAPLILQWQRPRFARPDVMLLAPPGEGTGGDLPTAPTLGPVWPNPFNPSADFLFALPPSADALWSPVRLEIFTVRGARVQTLLDEPLRAGQYQAHWDGTDDWGVRLGSGIYIVTLRAGGAVLSRKMVLTR